MGEANLQPGMLEGGFDYIALGNYHDFHEHKPNAFYAGATERFGFGEVESKPGFAIVEFDGGGYGVGVLSRWRILSADNHPLPRTPDREPRTALTVTVSPGRHLPPLAFTSTHFDSGRDVAGKNAQAAAINEMFTGDRDSLRIVAGDLNSRDDSDAVSTLRWKWFDASPTDNPGMSQWGWPWMRVDHVFARPLSRWRTIESRRLTTPLATTASDHLPVLVVLELSDK